jgi:small subunit ribosomal protein S2
MDAVAGRVEGSGGQTQGGNSVMAIVSMKALLESGVHFGHRTNKWDPHMKPYIFTERNGIHIIDLQQTVKLLSNAYNVIRDKVAEGGVVLFVGTKRQAQETIVEEAVRCGMPYVTERWLGGTLTNWSTIHQRILELERLEQLRDSGEINRLTKKEGLLIQRDIDRLDKRLAGLRNMKRLPDLLYVVDVCREDAAVHEANLLNIPIVALVDTNCNPQDIDYVIPSNDDAIRAIKLLVGKIADAVLEGKAMKKDEESEEQERAQTESPVVRKTARVVEVDDDLEDEDLLGEATLAKLTRNADDEDDDSAEESEEETEVEVKVEPKAEPKAEVKKEAKAKSKAKPKAKSKKSAEEENVEEPSEEISPEETAVVDEDPKEEAGGEEK